MTLHVNLPQGITRADFYFGNGVKISCINEENSCKENAKNNGEKS